MSYNLNENEELLLRLIQKSAAQSTLRKAVFSKYPSGEVKKTDLTLKSISGKVVLQAESFYSDNKAKHKNIELDDSTAALCELIDQLNEQIFEYEQALKRVTEERDEALAALAALREALCAIRKLTEV